MLGSEAQFVVLRHNGCTTIDAANHCLTTSLLRACTDRCTRTPAQARAHLPLNETLDIDRLCNIRHTRSAPNARTICCKNRVYQLTRTTMVSIRPSSAVEIPEHRDGSVHVYYKDTRMKEVTKYDIFNVALQKSIE